MVSIIVAIISLIGSCIAIYSNFIKDLFTSKKVVYKERLDKYEGGVNELYSNSDNSNYLHNHSGVMP